MRGIEGLERVDEQAIVTTLPGAAPLAPRYPGDRLGRDEHAARRTLRRQIARLELQLSRAVVGDLQAGARGRLETDVLTGRCTAPRLLDLGGLERRRDELVARLAEVEARRTEELHNRVLLREMYRDPAAHRYVRLETTDLAERGCRVYEVVPRFGIVGVLTGWWRVKVSSGCPLARASAGARTSAGGEARSIDGRPRGRPSCARARPRSVLSPVTAGPAQAVGLPKPERGPRAGSDPQATVRPEGRDPPLGARTDPRSP